LSPNSFRWVDDARNIPVGELEAQKAPLEAPPAEDIGDCETILRGYFKRFASGLADEFYGKAIKSGYSRSTMKRAAARIGVEKETPVDEKGRFLPTIWKRPRGS